MAEIIKASLGTAEANAFFTVSGGVALFFISWATGFSLLSPFYSHFITAALYFAILYLIARHFAKGGEFNPKPTPDLKGKNVVITGASSGIGFEAARDFARYGATVICVIRGSASRRAGCLKDLQTGLPPAAARNLSVLEMDISDFDSIRKGVPAVKAAAPKLHLLINNAGVAMLPFTRSGQGLEMQMATNHFGHFLLTQLLMDNLEKANGARVVNVSSLAHAFSDKLLYPLFEDEKSYNKDLAYGDSKLANIYFTQVFEEKFGESKNIHAYALHPGTVRTELVRHQPPLLLKLFTPIFLSVFKTSAQGAQTILHAALSTDQATCQPGQFHSDCQVWKTSPAAKNIDAARAFWKTTEEVIANATTAQSGKKQE